EHHPDRVPKGTACRPRQAYSEESSSSEASMRIRFWGTRGSLAKPGPSTVRYGGNTSCTEVQADDGTLIVLDCGTGAQALGQAIVAAGAAGAGHLLISHTHW